MFYFNHCVQYHVMLDHIIMAPDYIEDILPKGPYLPCVSMAGRALLAGYPWYLAWVMQVWLSCYLVLLSVDSKNQVTRQPHLLDPSYMDWCNWEITRICVKHQSSLSAKAGEWRYNYIMIHTNRSQNAYFWTQNFNLYFVTTDKILYILMKTLFWMYS